MNASLQEASELEQLCAEGRIDEALEVVRWGPFRESGGLCGPTGVPIASSWFRVLRVPLPGDPSGLAALPRFLAGADVAFELLVESAGGAPRLHIGLPDEQTGSLWLERLAPATLCELEDRPRHHPLIAGVTHRLAPTAEAAAPDMQRRLAGVVASVLRSRSASFTLRVTAIPCSHDVVDEYLHRLRQCELSLAGQRSSSVVETDRVTRTIDWPHVSLLSSWVGALAEQAQDGRATGLWRVAIHVGGDEATLAGLGGALVEGMANDGRRQWIVDRLVVADGAPPATTVFSTEDLVRWLTTPDASVDGLEVAPSPPRGRGSATVPRPLVLGTSAGSAASAVLNVDDLVGHVFVGGSTGSGKTTTVQGLLDQLYTEYAIPYLVIDPVKSEHRDLVAAHRGLVVGARDLALNILEPYPGFDRQTHLELVAGSFKGSFAMPAPVPYVATRLFDLLVEQEPTVPSPTLHDLADRLDDLVATLGYKGEVEANIRAALGMRLALLLAPHRAERLAARSSSWLANLFAHPALIELGELGDDEERSFVTSMLAVYVSEAARCRPATGGVQHVTVLEEAHRILPEPRAGGSDPDRGDPASVAARHLTQLLAEIRSRGEVVMVVDQSPGAVARDAVRSTNTKIVHRLVDVDDQRVAEASLGLVRETAGASFLGRLRPGEAVVSTVRVPEPHVVSVTRRTPTMSGADATASGPGGSRSCCGLGDVIRHHRAERVGRASEAAISHAIAAGLVGTDTAAAIGESNAQLNRLARRSGARPLCLLSVAVHRFVARLAADGRLDGTDVGDVAESVVNQWQTGSLELRSKLTAVKAGPFDVCARCDYPCDLRTVGALAATGRLRDLIEAAPPRREAEVVIEWGAVMIERDAALIGGAARSLVLCQVAHALHAAGRPTQIAAQISE